MIYDVSVYFIDGSLCDWRIPPDLSNSRSRVHILHPRSVLVGICALRDCLTVILSVIARPRRNAAT